MAEQTLAPCPFCGGEGEITPHFQDRAVKAVVCDECSSSSGWYIHKEEATAAWNRRTPPAAVPEGWQPISTAPKDGTKILIFRSGKVGIGWWDTDKFIKSPMPFWSGTDAQILGKGWAKSKNPTHWMPLPAAPTEASDE